MSLSIPTHMNPICTAMGDFVQIIWHWITSKEAQSACVYEHVNAVLYKE